MTKRRPNETVRKKGEICWIQDKEALKNWQLSSGKTGTIGIVEGTFLKLVFMTFVNLSL